MPFIKAKGRFCMHKKLFNNIIKLVCCKFINIEMGN